MTERGGAPPPFSLGTGTKPVFPLDKPVPSSFVLKQIQPKAFIFPVPPFRFQAPPCVLAILCVHSSAGLPSSPSLQAADLSALCQSDGEARLGRDEV